MPRRCSTLCLLALLVACYKDHSGPEGESRRYAMGFSAIPAKMDGPLLLPTLTLSSQYSHAGLIQLSIPWDILLLDTAAATEVRLVRLPLVNFYRGSGKQVVTSKLEGTGWTSNGAPF